jgi:hemolysin D
MARMRINQQILRRFEPLVQQGAIFQVQYLKQQQDVSAKQAEVIRLNREQHRLQLAIAQSQNFAIPAPCLTCSV